MMSCLKRLGCIAIVLPVAGCAWLPDAYSGCEESQPYQAAKQSEPLRVPSGADQPDTRAALRIPEVKSPELPPTPGRCLDHPPAFGTNAQANAGAASPSAGEGVVPAAAGGAMELGMGSGKPWETRLGANYLNTTDIDFDGGTVAEFDSSFGFMVGIGYDLSDHFEVGANFTYFERDYDADIAGDVPGEVFPVSGGIDSMGAMFDLTYNMMTGPFTPFLVTGVGWNWVDTRIPTEPPQVGCWWNPWYGYICSGFQDTKTVDGLAYELGAGLRYRFNESVALSGSYRMVWVDFPKADGTPSFDGFQLVLGWGF
jgi:opacity protein-like surface antigen